jgi:hypothetical protein
MQPSLIAHHTGDDFLGPLTFSARNWPRIVIVYAWLHIHFQSEKRTASKRTPPPSPNDLNWRTEIQSRASDMPPPSPSFVASYPFCHLKYSG